MYTPSTIASSLAAAFLAGPLEEEAMVTHGSRVLGKRWRWLRPVARRLVAALGARSRPWLGDVYRLLLRDYGFLRACEKYDLELQEPLVKVSGMFPVTAAKTWPLPAILSSGELADWLGLSVRELDWLADLRGWESSRSRGRLRNYHYRPLWKRWGQIRLIEAPKPRLKAAQRLILNGILNHIPPHAAAHGFRAGGSIQSFAAPHVGRRLVVRFDLQDFFPSITAARVRAIFHAVGYPDSVARCLTGLCTNSVPADIWDSMAGGPVPPQMRDTLRMYSQPHLPQGAPTSPALANLCAYRLDCRLQGLADSAGAVYTRYADDLAFSGDGDFARTLARFAVHIAATVIEEGFAVHYRKTRVMRQGVCQRLVGMVVNQRLNIPRADFDRLKATLMNCLRQGPATQNHAGHERFRDHLEGRISFVEQVNPGRGSKLRALFERIEWGQ